MRTATSSAIVLGVLLALGCSGEQGAMGERGEQGTPGERGERGEKGDNGDSVTATAVDSGAPKPAVPQPVWRDATGKFIPMSNVAVRRFSLGVGDAIQPSDVEFFVQDNAGLTWVVFTDLFEFSIALRSLDLYYKTTDCTGPAYTFVIPTKWTFYNKSSGAAKAAYYPAGAPVEQFQPSSARRDNSGSVCTTSQVGFTSKFLPVANAIEVPVIAPPNPYVPPYVLSFE